MTSSWQNLNQRISSCNDCQRLRDHCRQVASRKRRAYADQDYWGRPVPNMGPGRASLLIVGLAPGAHGANRTGRMFTGDRSGDWLFRALHKAGYCNQAESTSSSDGLRLSDCAITAVCHCAPPDNKPNSEEITQCQPFLDQTIRLLRPRVYLALGGLAWKAVARYAIDQQWLASPLPSFTHGSAVELKIPRRRKRCWLLGSYHPSQQNTFTGRLTEKMLDDVFVKTRQLMNPI
ncbi:MAG: uracil-DNA glycosylase [Mariniblastus sp.]|nr:uracil-DNA glycosylase [Mariniblastus sp.]